MFRRRTSPIASWCKQRVIWIGEILNGGTYICDNLWANRAASVICEPVGYLPESECMCVTKIIFNPPTVSCADAIANELLFLPIPPIKYGCFCYLCDHISERE